MPFGRVDFRFFFILYVCVCKLVLKIPWKNLYSEPVVAQVDGLYLLVRPSTEMLLTHLSGILVVVTGCYNHCCYHIYLTIMFMLMFIIRIIAITFAIIIAFANAFTFVCAFDFHQLSNRYHGNKLFTFGCLCQEKICV
ncbi:hypothetical protein pdam_00007613 [Pocillopora damicornis]|uniref:Uncharacterized protein n=1 Tax=Pocillopora damicornis TaxID=46731 RepID=A0A3M6TDT0_POCDA|nr:hypothetical protein pdam_00007613 [Pocillopora damicornis]